MILDDAMLCHGWAGLFLAVSRIASDALSPDITNELPRLRARLNTHLVQHAVPEKGGLLTGNAGVLLTLHTLDTPRPVDLGWETCLLLN